MTQYVSLLWKSLRKVFNFTSLKMAQLCFSFSNAGSSHLAKKQVA